VTGVAKVTVFWDFILCTIVSSDVSGEPSASIFTVTESDSGTLKEKICQLFHFM